MWCARPPSRPLYGPSPAARVGAAWLLCLALSATAWAQPVPKCVAPGEGCQPAPAEASASPRAPEAAPLDVAPPTEGHPSGAPPSTEAAEADSDGAAEEAHLWDVEPTR